LLFWLGLRAATGDQGHVYWALRGPLWALAALVLVLGLVVARLALRADSDSAAGGLGLGKVVVIAGLVLFSSLPAAYAAEVLLPGYVTGKSLGYSVAEEAGGLTALGSTHLPSCRHMKGPERWICTIDDPQGSSTTQYEVHQSHGSCWDGDLAGSLRGDGIVWPEQISGCVKLGDDIRLSRRFVDAL
jgi:hypothetical protein